ncbi:MAG: nuclear transport factor 2 family protein [Saprospiraceae bacterium]|nr:nuclear transport factor 2 family protein [Saprospiraceae bacterium]
MRRILLFSLLLIATIGFSQSKKQLKIEALERQRFEAMTTKNLAFLRNVLADDLTYVHSNGLLENKEQHLANISSGKLVYSTMLPEEIKVRVHGKSAVITGIVKVTGILNEKPFDIRLRYTDFYIKEKGKWRLTAWQSLRLEK